MYWLRKMLKNNLLLKGDFSTYTNDNKSHIVTKAELNHINNLFRQAEIFVLSDSSIANASDNKNENDDKYLSLGLPFKTCWIECPTDGKNARLIVTDISLDYSNIKCGSNCMLVDEVDVGTYDILLPMFTEKSDVLPDLLPLAYQRGDFLLSQNGDNVMWVSFFKGVNIDFGNRYAVNPIIALNHYIKAINSQSIATEITNQQIKIREKNKKSKDCFREISRIVRCYPKKQSAIKPITSNGEIDYSHRWSVRGHWRHIPGKRGKDRNGDYCIKNFTWIKPHEKGPDDKPLIHKTRIFQTSDD
jgi:hypothetical protein